MDSERILCGLPEGQASDYDNKEILTLDSLRSCRREDQSAAALGQQFVESSAGTFIWTTYLNQKMSEWVEVLVTYDVLEMEMVRSLLESGGIEVVIRSSRVSPYPVNIGRMGEIKVLVRAQDKDIAERVIQGAKDTDNPISRA